MENANKFDDQESISLPNHLLAIAPDNDGAKHIVDLLNRDGFSPDDVGVMEGTDDAGKLDALCGKKGFFAKLATIGIDMGDRDTEYVKEYRKALKEGKTVIGVLAKDDESREKARQILKSAGARFITLFGQLATQVLEA